MSRNERRLIKAAIKKFDEKGCHCCSRQPEFGEPYLVCQSAKGYIVIKSSCLRESSELSVVSIGAVGETKDPYQERDREWFEANPNRTYRLRLPYSANEVATLKHKTQLLALKQTGAYATGSIIEVFDSGSLAILVRQIRAGARVRVPVLVESNQIAVNDNDKTLGVIYGDRSTDEKSIARVDPLELSLAHLPGVHEYFHAQGESRHAVKH